MKELKKEVRTSSRTLYRGRILDLRVDQVRLPSGDNGVREIAVHRPAVAVVPLLDHRTVLLVRQFRYAVKQFMWEVPAGIMDRGETPRRAAARELAEETGFTARRWTSLGRYYSSPGFTTEMIQLFLANGLRKQNGSKNSQDPDEQVVGRAFPLAKVWSMVRRGEIRDAKTVLALQLALPARGGARD